MTRGPQAVIDQIRPRLRLWDGEGCFVLDYLRQEDPLEPRRRFVWAVKAGDDRAIEAASRLLAQSLSRREARRRLGAEHPILVAAPRHAPAMAPTPQERVCLRLTRLLPWLEHRPDTLIRTQVIRRSFSASQRPTVTEHLNSLAWTTPCPGAQVILIDDVFTLGRTTDACRMLLFDAGAHDIVVASLARTKLR